MRRVRGVAAVLLVAMLATACGASDGETSTRAAKEDAAEEAAGTSTTAPAAAEKQRAAEKGAKAGSATPTTASAGSASAAVKSAASTTAESGGGESEEYELPSEPLPMEVTLSSRCVRPGTPLTVSVKTVPQAQLGYDTTWADGRTGWDAPQRNGTAQGTADGAGTWQKTATIGADAPKGTAKLDAIGGDITGRTGRRTVEYQVSDALGKCS